MLNTIKALGLGQFYDNTGYNVLEIPMNELDKYEFALCEFVVKYPNLLMILTDEFGNVGGAIKGDNISIVVFDPEVWEANGMEWLVYNE